MGTGIPWTRVVYGCTASRPIPPPPTLLLRPSPRSPMAHSNRRVGFVRLLTAVLALGAPLVLMGVQAWAGEPGDGDNRSVSTAGIEAPAESSLNGTAGPEGFGAGHLLDPDLEPLRASRVPELFTPSRSPFAVRVGGQRIDFDVMAVVVLPGADVGVDLVKEDRTDYRLVHADGRAQASGPTGWTWTSPREPGATALRVEHRRGVVDPIHVNVLVAHPRELVEGGMLNGYRIGRYREKPLRGNPAYRPPRAFVEVEEGDRDILVSPHFRLGQFLCKQPGEPRYLALSAPLLHKLETVLEATNLAGYDVPTFHVMSGYRTPAYNRAIGNTTDYSRHLWGDAADIFVDVDGDGDMDDLNGDGRSTMADAQVLYEIVEGTELEGSVRPGGLGLYRRNAVRGPFVHVDARGHAARW